MKKFLKILLFLFLIFIVFAIYVATRPGSYDVKRTRLIKAPVSLVFNTVNEYKTWEKWGPWYKQDESIVVQYPEKTSGVGAGYSWTSVKDRGGHIKTLSVKDNKSIEQRIFFDGRDESDVYWNFEETGKGTALTWGMKGDIDFLGKLYFLFSGNPDEFMGEMLAEGLQNIDTYVHKEMDKHSITSNGVVEYTGGYFIYVSKECSFDEMGTAMDKMLPKVLIYAIKNQYPRAGAPFTLYHKYDEKNKVVSFSSCIPVRERVDPGEDIALAYMESGKYYKTTLQGAYKFSDEAWKKAFENAKNEGIAIDEKGKPFEVYSKGHTDSDNPADWVTEIYLPVK